MRISDWSSDVCSSDLNTTAGIPEPLLSRLRIERVGGPGPEHFESVLESILRDAAAELGVAPMLLPPLEPEVIGWLRTAFTGDVRRLRRADRKSVVSGKSVSVRVDIGGRRIIKKKKQKRHSLPYKHR